MAGGEGYGRDSEASEDAGWGGAMGQAAGRLPYRQCSAAGIPSRLHTVTAPVTGPASARSRVVVNMGKVPAAARKLLLPRAVSQTISSGNGRPDAAIRR